MSFQYLPYDRNCATPQPSSRSSTRNHQTNNLHSSQILRRDSFNNPRDNIQNHASPFINGKRNASFCHPSLKSNNVFYDFDYSYKNDLPNNKLLSPVKNDRFASQILKERLRTTSFDYGSHVEWEKRAGPLSSRSRPSEIDVDEHQYHSQGSVIGSRSQTTRNAMTPNDLSHKRPAEKRFNEMSLNPIPEEKGTVGRGKGQKGKYCYECVNSSLAEKKRHHHAVQKAKDKEFVESMMAAEREKKMSYDRQRIQKVMEKQEVNEKKNNKILEKYRREFGRPGAPLDASGRGELDQLEDRQDERAKQRRVVEDDLRYENAVMMAENRERKEFQRLDRLTSQHNSLQISGNGYNNKSLPTQKALMKGLQEQVMSNLNRKMKEKEYHERIGKQMIEAEKKAIEKEEILKRERMEKEKKLCEGQLKHWIQSREDKKIKEEVEKSKTVYYLRQKEEEHRIADRNQEIAKRNKQSMFRDCLQQHQTLSTYKKRFDQKKQYYEASLNIGKKKSEMYPCNGCNKMKEETHLTDAIID